MASRSDLPTPNQPRSDSFLAGDTRPVGVILKAVRQQHGLDLAQIATSLRIRVPFLAALEQGEVAALPGMAYAIGFVRAYADHLGLDSEELVRRFKHEASFVERRPSLSFPSPAPRGRVPGGLAIVLSLIGAALLFGGIYLRNSDLDLSTVRVPEVPERLSGSTAPLTPQPPLAPTALLPPDLPPAPILPAAPLLPAAPSGPVGPSLPTPAGPPLVGPPLVGPPSPATASAPPQTGIGLSAPSRPAPSTSPAAGAGSGPAAPPPVVTTALPPPPASVAALAVPPPPGDASRRPPVIAPVAPLPPPSERSSGPEDSPPSPPVPLAGEAPAAGPDPARAIPAPPVVNGAPPENRVFGVANGDSRVTIKARADSWVQIRDGENQTVLSRLLRAGDVFRVPNKPGLMMVTGNAGVLEITVDGAAVPPVGDVGVVRRNIALDPERLRAGTN